MFPINSNASARAVCDIFDFSPSTSKVSIQTLWGYAEFMYNVDFQVTKAHLLPYGAYFNSLYCLFWILKMEMTYY